MVGPIIPFLIKEGGKKLIKKYGQTNLLKNYTKNLLKEAKPLIQKSLKKAPLESRKFKGAEGAPIKVKEKLLKIDKLQKVNTQNSMYDKANPNIIRNTRESLKKIEKKVKSDYKKTDKGKQIKKEDSDFRKFKKKQKEMKDTFKDDGTPYGGRDFS
tara:strand:+ start:42 stop:509 length:468 start_codon:yes stop_codon:yes gene_type:complete